MILCHFDVDIIIYYQNTNVTVQQKLQNQCIRRDIFKEWIDTFQLLYHETGSFKRTLVRVQAGEIEKTSIILHFTFFHKDLQAKSTKYFWSTSFLNIKKILI